MWGGLVSALLAGMAVHPLKAPTVRGIRAAFYWCRAVRRGRGAHTGVPTT